MRGEAVLKNQPSSAASPDAGNARVVGAAKSGAQTSGERKSGERNSAGQPKTVDAEDLRAHARHAAHDVMSVLRHIGFFAREIIEDPEAGDNARASAERIMSRAQALDGMARSLRDFAMFLNAPAHKERISLSSVVAEALDRVGARGAGGADRSAEGAAGRLAVEILGDAEILADRAMLARACEAAIENAFIHGARGGATSLEIQISLEDGAARIVFSDDGAGIAPEAEAHVFAPFAKTTVKGEPPRLGLGLALCRVAAEAQGGEARLLPAADARGARLALTLPAA